MNSIFDVLLVVHVLLVFAIGLWLMAMGRDEMKSIPKGFLSLAIVTMVLSIAMMQINLMQHNENPDVYLLSPYKYGVKTIVFAILIGIVIKNYKKPFITRKTWLTLIALMALDLVITGVWM